MTSKNRLSHPESDKFLKIIFAVGLVFFLVLLLLFIQCNWGAAVRFLCGFYTIATGLFFMAQLYGFVISQTHYSDSVEAVKFMMLENEEAEWRK